MENPPNAQEEQINPAVVILEQCKAGAGRTGEKTRWCLLKLTRSLQGRSSTKNSILDKLPH